jgi:hypothetical protein
VISISTIACFVMRMLSLYASTGAWIGQAVPAFAVSMRMGYRLHRRLRHVQWGFGGFGDIDPGYRASADAARSVSR